MAPADLFKLIQIVGIGWAIVLGVLWFVAKYVWPFLTKEVWEFAKGRFTRNDAVIEDLNKRLDAERNAYERRIAQRDADMKTALTGIANTMTAHETRAAERNHVSEQRQQKMVDALEGITKVLDERGKRRQ